MRKFAFAAALLAGAVATPALAQDNPNLGGFHVDGIVGWDRSNIQNEHANGVTYGVGAGYDFRSGNAIFGVEAEATDSTADRSVTGAVIAGDSLRVRAGRDLYVGGRVGVGVGSNSLVYAKAGYTNAQFRADYNDGTAATVADFTQRTNLDGIRAGVGAQIGVGSRAYLRTEYRYSNYQDGVDRHQVVGGFGVRF